MAHTRFDGRDPFQNLRDREDARERQRDLSRLLIHPREPVRNEMDALEWQQAFVNPPELQTTGITNINNLIGWEDIRRQIDNGMGLSNHYLTENYQRSESEKQWRAERRRKFRDLYKIWDYKSTSALACDVNTSYGYYKRQRKSIEFELLEAICNGNAFKTKTTEYKPGVIGRIYLLDKLIVEIDTASYRICKIILPDTFTGGRRISNLFRLRLRQLGVRCLSIKNNNRLFLDKNYYVFIKPGQEVNIPENYKLICLPDRWLKKAIVEIHPQQIPLDLAHPDFPTEIQESQELKQFVTLFRWYRIRYFARLVSHGLVIRARADCVLTSNGSVDYIKAHYHPICHMEQTFSQAQVTEFGVRRLIERMFEKFKLEIRHNADYRDIYRKNIIRSTRQYANPFYQGGPTLTTVVGGGGGGGGGNNPRYMNMTTNTITYTTATTTTWNGTV